MEMFKTSVQSFNKNRGKTRIDICEAILENLYIIMSHIFLLVTSFMSAYIKNISYFTPVNKGKPLEAGHGHFLNGV